MLHNISWQQYFVAVVIVSAAWYMYVGLRYYRAEVTTWLKIKPAKQGVVPPVANQMTVVMGAAKPETDTGLYQAEDLCFAANEPDDISDQTLPKGPGDDLLAEAMVLIEAYGENDNKSEFLSLFKLLLHKYEVFADEISLNAVITPLKTFAAHKLPFQIQADEWPLTLVS